MKLDNLIIMKTEGDNDIVVRIFKDIKDAWKYLKQEEKDVHYRGNYKGTKRPEYLNGVPRNSITSLGRNNFYSFWEDREKHFGGNIMYLEGNSGRDYEFVLVKDDVWNVGKEAEVGTMKGFYRGGV